jgi:hypothetical protein
MIARPYVFDAPVQRLRAGDRVIRSAVPELAGRTVVYVKTARHPGGEPLPFAPVAVVVAPAGPVSDLAMLRSVPDNPDTAAEELAPGLEEEPAIVGWGTRITIERIPEPDEVFYVSAGEPLTPDARLTVQVTSALEITPDEWPNSFGDRPAPPVGGVIARLVEPESVEGYPVSAIDVANLRGEVIDAYWYVDGHRVETPNEQSAREAADIFAGHVVRLHPAGMDAGETCPRCRRIVSWVDHAPALKRGQFVRCTARTPRAVG